ncbi:MAG TPA: hypothetical protein PLS55_14520, partial [Thermogutta sp.]|nr:hypothetical protein [Thermogutta sp.]
KFSPDLGWRYCGQSANTRCGLAVAISTLVYHTGGVSAHRNPTNCGLALWREFHEQNVCH